MFVLQKKDGNKGLNGRRIKRMSLLFPAILYSGSTEKKMIATSSRDHFSPLLTFSHRVQQVGMGGLMILHVTPEDAGSYTVEVNGTNDLFALRSVTLHVDGNWDKV